MNIRCNHHVASFDYSTAVSNEDYPLIDQPLYLTGLYTFEYDYPLSERAAIQRQITRAMSVIDILILARHDYETIYAAEDAATLSGATGYIPGTLNRNRSSGPYGIWGHVLSDLYFEQVNINPDTSTISFGIGS
jgi:hypothetical protein